MPIAPARYGPPSSPRGKSDGHFDFTGAESHNFTRIDLMDREHGDLHRPTSVASFQVKGSGQSPHGPYGAVSARPPHHAKTKGKSGRDDYVPSAAAKASTWVRKVHRAKREFLAKSKSQLSDVAIGRHFTVLLSDDGNAFSFGSGLGHMNMWQIPTPRDLRILSVACGHKHVALLMDTGDVFTFGSGSRGQLGHGANNFNNLATPSRVETLANEGVKVRAVSCGHLPRER